MRVFIYSQVGNSSQIVQIVKKSTLTFSEVSVVKLSRFSFKEIFW
jgi:hypothetical protein